MTTGKLLPSLALTLLPFTAAAGDLARDPLPCGIYDEKARPLTERDLETQSPDPSRYTMELATGKGRKIAVEVKSVSIQMPGERNQVSVFLDGKPLAKTSHQDVPIYLEVHVDGEKYRIICVRVDEAVSSAPSSSGPVMSEQTGTGQKAGSK